MTPTCNPRKLSPPTSWGGCCLHAARRCRTLAALGRVARVRWRLAAPRAAPGQAGRETGDRPEWGHGCHQTTEIYTVWGHGCHQTVQICRVFGPWMPKKPKHNCFKSGAPRPTLPCGAAAPKMPALFWGPLPCRPPRHPVLFWRAPPRGGAAPQAPGCILLDLWADRSPNWRQAKRGKSEFPMMPAFCHVPGTDSFVHMRRPR